MALEKLYNFRFPVSQPTVFDEQEMSSLELNAKTAYKVNELIETINSWITHIEEYSVKWLTDNWQSLLMKALINVQVEGTTLKVLASDGVDVAEGIETQVNTLVNSLFDELTDETIYSMSVDTNTLVVTSEP